MIKKLFFTFVILGFFILIAPFEVDAASLKFVEYSAPYVVEEETYLFDDTQTNEIKTMEGLNYNGSTNTLTIKNFAKEGNLVIEDMGDLKLKVEGNNTIEIEHHPAIDFNKTNLIFSGSGTLNLKAGWGMYARSADNYIEIGENFTGNFNINAEVYDGINIERHDHSIGIYNPIEHLIIKNGNINITSDSLGIRVSDNINITGGNITINSQREGIIAHKINIADAFITVDSQQNSAIRSDEEIKLSEGMLSNRVIDYGDFIDDEGNRAKNVVITPPKVTINTTNISATSESLVKYGSEEYLKTGKDIIVNMKPEAGYKLPENIIVKISDNILKPGDYSYDWRIGQLIIPINKITDNVEISQEAILIPRYTVTINPVEGARITPNGVLNEALEGSNLDVQIKAEEGYKIIAVKVNNVEQVLPLQDDLLLVRNIKEDINVIVEVEKEEIDTDIKQDYFMEESKNQEFVQGTDKTIYFLINTYKASGKVLVDGTELSKNDGDYTWAFLEGTYPCITLSEKYMNTLKAGTHTIKVIFDDGGEDETKFVIVEQDNDKPTDGATGDSIDNSTGDLAGDSIDKPADNSTDVPKNNPQTGDNIWMFAISLVISVIGILVTTKLRKNKN